jgi:hypothetical protein
LPRQTDPQQVIFRADAAQTINASAFTRRRNLMKVLVIHDKGGNIESFGIADKKFAGQVTLQPPPGKYVTEVEVAAVKDISGNSEKEHERLRKILKGSRLDQSGAKPKLIEK